MVRESFQSKEHPKALAKRRDKEEESSQEGNSVWKGTDMGGGKERMLRGGREDLQGRLEEFGFSPEGRDGGGKRHREGCQAGVLHDQVCKVSRQGLWWEMDG